MRGNLLIWMSAGLLVALNANAAESTSPASAMVLELADASGKCQQISLEEHLQEQNDNTMIGNAAQTGTADRHPSAAMNAIAEASINRKAGDGRSGACLDAARDTGKAAYRKYQAVPGQPQAVRKDAEAVYNVWLAALPDLSKVPTPNAPELSALQKNLAALRADDAAK